MGKITELDVVGSITHLTHVAHTIVGGIEGHRRDAAVAVIEVERDHRQRDVRRRELVVVVQPTVLGAGDADEPLHRRSGETLVGAESDELVHQTHVGAHRMRCGGVGAGVVVGERGQPQIGVVGAHHRRVGVGRLAVGVVLAAERQLARPEYALGRRSIISQSY